MALSGAAIATLKYWNDGASNPARPSHLPPFVIGGASGAGIVTWITQPAGDALSVMHPKVARETDHFNPSSIALRCSNGPKYSFSSSAFPACYKTPTRGTSLLSCARA